MATSAVLFISALSPICTGIAASMAAVLMCAGTKGGLPLDQDVYDAAEWSCLGELTAASIANGGMPVQMPDFTRGDWNKVQGYRHAE